MYPINPNDPKPGFTHVMNIDFKDIEEARVREMRNQVYGQPISDKEWETCKANWMRPEETAWLEAEVRKLAKSNPVKSC